MRKSKYIYKINGVRGMVLSNSAGYTSLNSAKKAIKKAKRDYRNTPVIMRYKYSAKKGEYGKAKRIFA